MSTFEPTPSSSNTYSVKVYVVADVVGIPVTSKVAAPLNKPCMPAAPCVHPKVRIRGACIGAFVDDIRQGKCDAFYVRINKDLTINEKRKALAKSRKRWNSLKKANQVLTDSQLKLKIIRDQVMKLRRFGKWQDKWVLHPFPDSSEPEKAVCYLTDLGKYEEDHVAWLYNKASLHGIDRFFMQARRRISLLERSIATPSAAGRKWFGYSPYNPAIVIKMLDIFRVFYNFVETGKDCQSPAMKMGLAKGTISMEDILYYSRV